MSNTSVPTVSPDEVAAYLGVKKGTLAAWRYRRRGPRYHKVGTRVRYRLTDVDAWLEKNASDARRGRR